MSSSGCAGNSEAWLCIGFPEAILISWTVALVLFFLTIIILGYRIYLDKVEYASNLVQLNETRVTSTEATNAMWRALSVGYSLSILLAGLSVDAENVAFFHGTAQEIITYLLFLSRVPIVIGAIGFAILSLTTNLFRAKLAFPTISSNHPKPISSATSGSISFCYFSAVYILSFVDLALLKMLPWRGTEFTLSYLGYPTSNVLYLSIFAGLLSKATQFVACMIMLPKGISGVRHRTRTYYLPITNSIILDEMMYWLYILFTCMEFLACSIYASIIIHHTLSGKLQRMEVQSKESVQWQRLATSEDAAMDSTSHHVRGGDKEDEDYNEIEFGNTHNPIMSSVTSANLNKRSSNNH